jgi:hypothetical protein
MRRALTAVLLLAVAGCSPYAHTIGGVDEPILEQITNAANAACQERTGELPPSPFTTDGCTLAPDGQWQSCCIEHDMVYWCGGSPKAREDADEKLRACVAQSGGPGWVTTVVRALGHPYTPAPWRWGYGWTYGRGYTEDKAK